MRSSSQSYSFPSHRSHQQLPPTFFSIPLGQSHPLPFHDPVASLTRDMTSPSSLSEVSTPFLHRSADTPYTKNMSAVSSAAAISSSSSSSISLFDSTNPHHFVSPGDSFHPQAPFTSVKTSSDFGPNGNAVTSHFLNISHPLSKPVPHSKFDSSSTSYLNTSNTPPLSDNMNENSASSCSSSVLRSRHADRFRRLQTPGLMIFIHADNFERNAEKVTSRFYSSMHASEISYSRLLNLISISCRSSIARNIVATHSVTAKDSSARKSEPFLTVTTPTSSSPQQGERATDICMARLLTQEFEGVHLLGCAHQRVFCVVSIDQDYVDVIRHARFSGCDVELWFWLTSDNLSPVWTSELSLQHDNIGSLRIHILNPHLPYLTGVEDKPKIFTDNGLTYNTFSSSFIQNVDIGHAYKDRPSQVNFSSKASPSTMPTPSLPVSTQHPLYTYDSMHSKRMTMDRQLHSHAPLPTSVWSGYQTFITQNAQSISPPSSKLLPSFNPFKHTADRPSASNISLSSGLSDISTVQSAHDTMSGKSAPFPEPHPTATVREGMLFNDFRSNGISCNKTSGREIPVSQNPSPTDSDSPKLERDVYKKLTDFTITGNVLLPMIPQLPSDLLCTEDSAPVAGSTTPTSPTNDPADSPSPQINTAFASSVPDYRQGQGHRATLMNGSAFVSDSNQSYGDQRWCIKAPTNTDNAECSDKIRSAIKLEDDDTENEIRQNIYEGDSTSSSGISKPKTHISSRGRCTYREFCNRRQCNGSHTKAELAYFSRYGGRAKYCLGKQKLCARGATCDGRKRRSGVCSFLHQGELPFCASCLGSHSDGACDVERNKTISENEAAQLVIVGCLVPVTTRQATSREFS